MGAIADILLVEGSMLKKAIADNMRSQNRNATGDTVKGIKVVATDSRLTLTDTKGTLIFSEVGRGPNRSNPATAKPSYTFVQQIAKWTLKKGIKGGLTEKQRNSFAYAIATTIARKGNRLHRSGKNSGVVSEAVNQAWLNKLMAKLTPEYTAIIKTEILKTL